VGSVAPATIFGSKIFGAFTGHNSSSSLGSEIFGLNAQRTEDFSKGNSMLLTMRHMTRFSDEPMSMSIACVFVSRMIVQSVTV